MNSIDGATLVCLNRQLMSRRQQTIIGRLLLQIRAIATGLSSFDGTVVDDREFSC